MDEISKTAPPPMPHAAPAAAAAAEPVSGWAVDTREVRAFGDAVVRARSFLDAVQMKIERMQGAELTPQIGTSPVGQQLARKFDDRLNSTDGLRAMLAEAMRRMDTFVASAEEAAKSYEDMDETGREGYQKAAPAGTDGFDG